MRIYISHTRHTHEAGIHRRVRCAYDRDVAKLFQTNPEEVGSLVEEIDHGKVALPDFQRNFIWPASNTARLLASILARFPAGALLMWRAKKGTLPERPVAGAPDVPEQDGFPERLVLDGQQRLTALYRSLRGVGFERYFVALKEFVDPDTLESRDEDDILWEKAVVAREPSKRELAAIRRGDTPAYDEIDWQLSAWYFPVHKFRDVGGFDDWMEALARTLPDEDKAKTALRQVRDTYLTQLRSYEFPVITLTGDATLRAVCRIFETLNTNTVRLGVFEILTAKFYPNEVDLRGLWKKAKEDHPVLRDAAADKDPDGFGIDPYLVLQAVALRVHRSPQQKTVLEKLTAQEVANYWDVTVLSLKRVIELLRDECGVIHRDLLPYQMILVPLTGAWMERDNMTGPAQAAALVKIKQYFWSSVLTTNFDQGGASQAEKDYRDLVAWMNGQQEDGTDVVPEAVSEIPISADVLLSASVTKKALLSAVMALTVEANAKDFHNGQRLTPTIYVQDKVNSHHLYPRKRLTDQNADEGIDSQGFSPELILNRALIDASTNKRIGAKKPSVYVEEIRSEVADADDIFESHLIDVAALEGDDYKAFLTSRLANLVERIESVTGKTVVPLTDSEPVEDDLNIDDDPET